MEERERRVREVAAMLELTDYLDRKPGQLSGGQRQRVAMGRAIVRHPKVFLMDEPLSNLDAKLRVQMRADIAELQSRLGVTTVYVTHDQAEALTLGHRVAVLDGGRLQQCDAPRVLYERPANTFVAGFIGSPAMNLVDVELGRNGSVTLCHEQIPVPPAVTAAAAQGGWKTLTVGLRPESLELAADGVPARVQVVEDVGADSFVFCAADLECGPVNLVARVDTRSAPARDERVSIRLRTTEAHLFDPDTGARVEGG
jgi:multiple sugar transport system ATP-binding protein